MVNPTWHLIENVFSRCTCQYDLNMIHATVDKHCCTRWNAAGLVKSYTPKTVLTIYNVKTADHGSLTMQHYKQELSNKNKNLFKTAALSKTYKRCLICSYPKKLFQHNLALVILKFIHDLIHCWFYFLFVCLLVCLFFAYTALSPNHITSFCTSYELQCLVNLYICFIWY